MKENKNTCPVCFTKMRVQGDGLVCPECGYKYCDHKYKQQDIYNTDHTHTPQYTTAYPAARTGAASNSGASHPVTKQTPTDMDPRSQKIIKLVRTIVIIYIIFFILSTFGSGIAALLTQMLFSG